MRSKLTRIWDEFGIFFEKEYNLIFWMIIIAYFLLSFSNGLIKGGRWDLYENIAMADRFLSGRGLYYSIIEASSPYFPGVSFLAIAIGYILNPIRDYVLLFIASIIGAALLVMLIKMGEKFSGNKVISLLITSALLFMGFNSYKTYMNEFKADSAVLLIGIILVFLIERIETDETKNKLRLLIEIFILAFVMDVTKQQALYVDAGLALYIIFSKRLQLVNKIKILASISFAGILDLCVIFSIPGLYIQTIQNLKDMPYWSVKSIISQMGACFKLNIFFFLLLFLFLILLLLRKLTLSGLSTKWLLISVIFGCAQILGGWKNGGNSGNYEVGMVAFLPFTVMATEYLYREYIVEKKKHNVLTVCNLGMALYCIGVLGFVTCAKVPAAINKIQADNDVSAYLSEKIGTETIMYYSNNYMQIARSTVNPGMDLYTTPCNIEEYWDMRGEYIASKAYKYIYVNPDDLKSFDEACLRDHGVNGTAFESLMDNYTSIVDPEMPESLVGQLYVIK